ncbi:hypothetical protein BJ165DRAFT_1611641 [Panaeolus papilionaceus]|nr:hypothetical protein BJ165DRAFT_1611641 [Panaeolus papilionaceus]
MSADGVLKYIRTLYLNSPAGCSSIQSYNKTLLFDMMIYRSFLILSAALMSSASVIVMTTPPSPSGTLAPTRTNTPATNSCWASTIVSQPTGGIPTVRSPACIQRQCAKSHAYVLVLHGTSGASVGVTVMQVPRTAAHTRNVSSLTCTTHTARQNQSPERFPSAVKAIALNSLMHPISIKSIKKIPFHRLTSQPGR